MQRKQAQGITTGVNAPSNPAKGDLFYEANASGVLLYGWAWWWDGFQWCSPNLFWDIGTPSAGITTSFDSYFVASTTVKHQFLSNEIRAFCSVAGTASAYWSAVLNIRQSNNAKVSLSVSPLKLIGSAANNWGVYTMSITNNVQSNSATYPIFSLEFSPTGSAGNLIAAARTTYRLIRI